MLRFVSGPVAEMLHPFGYPMHPPASDRLELRRVDVVLQLVAVRLRQRPVIAIHPLQRQFHTLASM